MKVLINSTFSLTTFQKKSFDILVCVSTIGIQTDDYLSIRQQYQYGNLRRVNSNLVDYIFIPTFNQFF